MLIVRDVYIGIVFPQPVLDGFFSSHRAPHQRVNTRPVLLPSRDETNNWRRYRVSSVRIISVGRCGENKRCSFRKPGDVKTHPVKKRDTITLKRTDGGHKNNAIHSTSIRTAIKPKRTTTGRKKNNNNINKTSKEMPPIMLLCY